MEAIKKEKIQLPDGPPLTLKEAVDFLINNKYFEWIDISGIDSIVLKYSGRNENLQLKVVANWLQARVNPSLNLRKYAQSYNYQMDIDKFYIPVKDKLKKSLELLKKNKLTKREKLFIEKTVNILPTNNLGTRIYKYVLKIKEAWPELEDFFLAGKGFIPDIRKEVIYNTFILNRQLTSEQERRICEYEVEDFDYIEYVKKYYPTGWPEFEKALQKFRIINLNLIHSYIQLTNRFNELAPSLLAVIISKNITYSLRSPSTPYIVEVKLNINNEDIKQFALKQIEQATPIYAKALQLCLPYWHIIQNVILSIYFIKTHLSPEIEEYLYAIADKINSYYQTPFYFLGIIIAKGYTSEDFFNKIHEIAEGRESNMKAFHQALMIPGSKINIFDSPEHFTSAIDTTLDLF